MSLYAVMRPTSIEEAHCVDAPKYNSLPVPATTVWTRFGRLAKKVPTNQARRVSGRVIDLESGLCVYDASGLA